MLGKTTVVLTLALLMVVAVPVPACAERELVSQRVTHATGSDALVGTLSDIESVQIGSSVTTVTLHGAERDAPLVVDYSSVTGTSEAGGGASALVPLLTVSAGAVALRSVLGLLGALGRLGNGGGRR
jgi:hypothetical protein